MIPFLLPGLQPLKSPPKCSIVVIQLNYFCYKKPAILQD